MDERKEFPLREFCKRQHLPYESTRKLGLAGRFPITRHGRRLYVHLDVWLEWCRAGGSGLASGWRHKPPEKERQTAVAAGGA